MTKQIIISTEWLAACGMRKFAGRALDVVSERDFGSRGVFYTVALGDGRTWEVWDRRGVTVTSSARAEYKKWYSACRACVRDQRLARSHKAGSLRSEQIFWAEHKDRIVFRAGYQNRPNGLSNISGPMSDYWRNREWHGEFNRLRYAWAFRGAAWYRATLASMRVLRAG